jgi:hypothetical protein
MSRTPQLFRIVVGDPEDDDGWKCDIVAFSMREALALFEARHPNETPTTIPDEGDIEVHPDVHKTWMQGSEYR